MSADARRVRAEHFSSADDLVRMMLALRGPQWATPRATKLDFDLARELNVRITVHVGDGLWGARTLLGEAITAGAVLGLVLILAGSYLGGDGRLPGRMKRRAAPHSSASAPTRAR